MSGILVHKILQTKQEQIPFVIFFISIFLQKYFLFEIRRLLFFLFKIIHEANWLNDIIFADHRVGTESREWRLVHTWKLVGAEWQTVVPFAMTKWSRQNCRVQPAGDNGASNEGNRRITPGR